MENDNFWCGVFYLEQHAKFNFYCYIIPHYYCTELGCTINPLTGEFISEKK